MKLRGLTLIAELVGYSPAPWLFYTLVGKPKNQLIFLGILCLCIQN